MNTYLGQHIGSQLRVLLGVGILSLWLHPVTGATALGGTATVTPSSPPEHSQINRSIAGARTGVLKMMTENTAQIDNVTYRLAPHIMVETQSGQTLSRSPQWQKRIQYPVPVQYWADKNVIIQMVVLSRAKDGAQPQRP